MSIKVYFSESFKQLVQFKTHLELRADSVGELLDNLEVNFSGFKKKIYDEKGNLYNFINIFVNKENIKFLKKEATELKDKNEVLIIQAIAGG